MFLFLGTITVCGGRQHQLLKLELVTVTVLALRA